MSDGLRRRDFRVKNLDVSGQVTGNTASAVLTKGNTWYVDASQVTAASGDGTTWAEAFLTITEALAVVGAGDVVYVAAPTHTDFTGDPVSYAETLIIPYAASNLAIIGVSRGRTQGGLPQVKIGAGSTAMLKIRAPGCLIANMGFNGASSTGGGVLLDDDYAAKAAFGTTISNCHFKNCIVTDTSDGGAIYTTSAGNAWQVLITGCKFYKNASDIALIGTSSTVPQDWVIEDCIFSGPAASVDCQVNLKGAGSGINGVAINNCVFPVLGTLTAGTIKRMVDLTGCVGSITNCTFGAQSGTSGGTQLTWKAAGTAAFIPTTVKVANCHGESLTADESGEITIA